MVEIKNTGEIRYKLIGRLNMGEERIFVFENMTIGTSKIAKKNKIKKAAPSPPPPAIIPNNTQDL